MTWFTSVWEEVFTERLSQSVRSHPDDVRNAFVSHPFFSFIFDCLSRIGLLQVEYSSKNTPQYIQFAILRKTRLRKGVYLPGVCVRSSVHIPPTFAMLSRCTSSFALPLDGLLRISHFLFLVPLSLTLDSYFAKCSGVYSTFSWWQFTLTGVSWFSVLFLQPNMSYVFA